MPDRTVNWGGSQLDAKYQTGDSDPAGGDFVVAQRADGSQVLLQWNDTAGQWESTGDVDLGGNNLNSVGTAMVSALKADNITTSRTWQNVTSSRSFDTVETNNSGSEISLAIEIGVTSSSTEIGAFVNIDGRGVVGTNKTVGVGSYIITVPHIPADSNYEIETFGDVGGFELSDWEEFRP